MKNSSYASLLFLHLFYLQVQLTLPMFAGIIAQMVLMYSLITEAIRMVIQTIITAIKEM